MFYNFMFFNSDPTQLEPNRTKKYLLTELNRSKSYSVLVWTLDQKTQNWIELKNWKTKFPTLPVRRNLTEPKPWTDFFFFLKYETECVQICWESSDNQHCVPTNTNFMFTFKFLRDLSLYFHALFLESVFS